MVWTLARSGQNKVIVDGSFWDGSDGEGIREVFRDSEGCVLLQFCKEVRVDSVVKAEVLVLREGL